MISSAFYLRASGLRVANVVPFLAAADYVREYRLQPLLDLHCLTLDVDGATDVGDDYGAILYDEVHAIPSTCRLKRGKRKTI